MEENRPTTEQIEKAANKVISAEMPNIIKRFEEERAKEEADRRKVPAIVHKVRQILEN